MIYIETDSLDPTWNLAFEEYCFLELKQFPRIMLLWQNENAIIVGRYQNAEKEINVEAARALGVKVVRRSTGGGTVYHDMGNLNYSFILPTENPKYADISVVSRPIVNALRSLGVPAEVQGRNDIVVDGKKISGTAQRFSQGRLLHHGTLLFDSNLELLQSVLKVDAAKIVSKGVTSVRSRVTNIKEHIPENRYKDINAFWKALLEAFEQEGELTRYQLTPEDLEKVKELQKTKYNAWDWSVGRAPAFDYTNSKRFPGGKIEIRFNVDKGIIQTCELSGDFLGLVALDELENALKGLRYERGEVRQTLDGLNLSMFLGSITPDDFVECMFEGAL